MVGARSARVLLKLLTGIHGRQWLSSTGISLGSVAMTENADERIRESLDEIYRSESRRILATLIRLLGDFDLGEDALHDAFRPALERWQKEALPANPRTWLISTGRFKAIDAMRRRVRFDASQSAITQQLYADTSDAAPPDDESVE